MPQRKHRKTDRMRTAALLTVLFALVLAGACAEGAITEKAQLNRKGVRVGVGTGSAAMLMAEREFPDAEIVYLNATEGYEAVAQGKIDAFVYDRAQMELAIRNGLKGVRLLEENMEGTVRIAAGISPVSAIPDLEKSVNAFIAGIRADGTLDDMYRRWVTEGDTEMPEIAAPAEPALRLTVGTSGIAPPFSYYAGTELTGYDIELARRFAAWLNADLRFGVYDYGALITAAAAGDADLILANLNVTPEREEALIFSEPLCETPVGILVKGDPAAPAAYDAVDRLDGMLIGSATGTTYDDLVLKRLPNARFSYYNTYSDMVAALASGRIAAFACDEPVLATIMAENSIVTMLPEYLDTFEFGFVFAKNDAGAALCGQMSEFIRKIRENGELDRLQKKWTGGMNDAEMPDVHALDGKNGVLTMATDALNPPFVFVRDNEIAGLEIELAIRFCDEYGYALEIRDMSFDAILTSVQTGKADFGGATITITEERAASVLFSEPFYAGGTVLAVLKPQESTGGNTAGGRTPEYRSFSDLDGKRVSMLDGAPFEELVRSKAPGVAEFSYFSTMTDILAALKSGKTDAVLSNNAVSQLSISRDPGLALFPESLSESFFGIAFAKGDPQRDVWQAAYDALPKEAIDAAWAKWTGADEGIKTLPAQDWPGLNGTVRAAVCDTLEPMSYAGEGGEPKGFDLEIILMIARQLDVHVEFEGMAFSSVLPCVQSGKALLGAGSIIVTDERKESVDFVEHYPAAFVLVVRAVGEAEEGNTFLDGLLASFEKTFLRENRWQLFLRGIATTLVITLLSVLCGTALGFLVFMLCRNGNPAANGITRFCLWLVQGMPMVVLLMVLYYIVFGHVAISGIVVAVIGFTLTFGSSVFGLLRMGVGAVDRGQYEAAYALGYSDRRTFFRFILPQALPHVLPSFRGETVGLIKATAVVGYIAVQDLTKMGDIIRSRTYEAFFPLIAVTVIYFILESLIKLLIDTEPTMM